MGRRVEALGFKGLGFRVRVQGVECGALGLTGQVSEVYLNPKPQTLEPDGGAQGFELDLNLGWGP